MDSNAQINVVLNIDAGMFGGCYANMFQISTTGSESKLDCVYIDKTTIDGGSDAIGKIVARVNMTTESLIELRALLDRHLNGVFANGENENESE